MMVKNYDFGQFLKMELVVYCLIVCNFLVQFYLFYWYNLMVVEVFCEGEIFKVIGIVEMVVGWKVLFCSDGVLEKDDENQVLLKMVGGDVCKFVDVCVDVKKILLLFRFDGVLFIDVMEKVYFFVIDLKVKVKLKEMGIGMLVICVVIVDKLVKDEYVEEVKEGKCKVYILIVCGCFLYQVVFV